MMITDRPDLSQTILFSVYTRRLLIQNVFTFIKRHVEILNRNFDVAFDLNISFSFDILKPVLQLLPILFNLSTKDFY